jgi:hypothetical protein
MILTKKASNQFHRTSTPEQNRNSVHLTSKIKDIVDRAGLSVPLRPYRIESVLLLKENLQRICQNRTWFHVTGLVLDAQADGH